MIVDGPRAAPEHFPYRHRNLAQVRADELAEIRRTAQAEATAREYARMEVFGEAVERGPFPAWGSQPQHVHRTPCHRCGVRADIGCRHQSSYF